MKIRLTDLESQLEQAGINTKSSGSYPESPYLAAGEHTVSIVDVVNKGPNKLDPTWVDVEIVVEGGNKKTRKGVLSAPTQKITYGKFDQKTQFYKFKDFAKAMGINNNELAEKLPEVVDELVNNGQALVGASVEVVIGYDANHIKKTEGGVMIANYKGEAHPLFQGQVFPDRDSAMAAAKLKGVYLQLGPTVIKYKPTANGPGIKVGQPKSAKETVTKKPGKQLPF